MAALKLLVVAMGIAIVAGASVLATLMFERVRGLGGPGGQTAGAPARLALALPAGAVVLDAGLDGNRPDGERVVVRVRLADGAEALFVFDAATGRPVGRYDLVPGAPAPGKPAPGGAR